MVLSINARCPRSLIPGVHAAMILVCLLWMVIPAVAHSVSDAYLSIHFDKGICKGRLDVALRDLEVAVGLDANKDGVITWEELEARQKETEAYAKARLKFESGSGEAPIVFKDLLVDFHGDGGYAVIAFELTGARADASMKVAYNLLFDQDPSHRGLFQLDWGNRVESSVFTRDHATQVFAASADSALRQFWTYCREGVGHIWTGYDHILFLVALLLPAVLTREGGRWQGVPAFRPALLSVIKVVTAFTVAHSITLTLAALGVVKLPSRLVESVIAASVVLAAANNLKPIVRESTWIIAFCFGLVHGFGFASVLNELGLPRNALALSLVGFNSGVELGQLAIVAAFFPVAYGSRQSIAYQRWTLGGGSIVIVLLATTWMCERIFNFKVLPF